MSYEMLKITATNGTYTLVPESSVLGLDVSAAGKITRVAYKIQGTGGHDTVNTTDIPAFDGTNTRYEFVCLTDGPIYRTLLSN
jgi:hypothetical protein